VHWNKLRDCYSVLNAATSRLEAHQASLALEDVRFVVRPAGRAMARATGSRNVHAFAVGRLIEPTPDTRALDALAGSWVFVGYDPFACSSFVELGTNAPVVDADLVVLTSVGGRAVVRAFKKGSTPC